MASVRATISVDSLARASTALGGQNQRLSSEVPAALGARLIFDLHRGGAVALEQANGALDVERVAVAGVGVDHQVERAALVDVGQGLRDLGEAHQTDVRTTEPAVCDARPGEVRGVEAGLLGDHGPKRVVDAGRDHDGRAGETRGQGWFGAHRRLRSSVRRCSR
jgi:hypothetical protein